MNCLLLQLIRAQIIFFLSRKHLIEFDMKPWVVVWEEDNHQNVLLGSLSESICVSFYMLTYKSTPMHLPCL